MQEDKKVEWTQQMLEDLITNKVEENVHLDFKSGEALPAQISDKKKEDICKDVSAFANSDGGVLIYGITEVDHKADSFSYVDGDAFTKERLEQIINNGINRRIDGIVITPVRMDGDIQKTVYVVDIPVSPLAPHMVKDNRYYKRFNFTSVAMEEYEVRHTFNRKGKVLLDFADVSIEITNRETWMDDQEFEFKLTFHIGNPGRTVARDYKLRVVLKGADGLKYSYYDNKGYNHVSPGQDVNMILSTTNSIPIFPEEFINALEFKVIVPFNETNNLESVEIKQTLFTESERLDDTFKPGEIMDKLIAKCVDAEPDPNEGEDQG